MKRLLNTLYITSPGSYLSREGETVKISIEHKVRLRIPVHTLSAIVCFGQVSCSPPLMGLCAESGITLSFLSEYGKFWARVEGPVSGNVLLRRTQYRYADDPEFVTKFASIIVTAKLANTRTVLLRAMRDHPNTAGQQGLNTAAKKLKQLIRGMDTLEQVDSVRGREGDGARRYFEVFNHLVVAQKDDFVFNRRSRRPPLDKINALLSFFYTLLTHDIRSALEGVGLDPAVGYLHRDRPGRPGLALDMIEEFRAFLVDRLVLSLINRTQIKAGGFKIEESGSVRMNDETRKTVLTAWQQRKQEEITHPYLNEKVAIGLLPHIQAQLLARYLRGELDAYPPFFWK